MITVEKNVLLNNKVWFQTGGNAQYFFKATTIEEVIECVAFAKKNNIAITVLGLGANVLISDEGIEGLVMQISINTIKHTVENDFVRVEAGAGVTIENLITYCLDNTILGLEEFSGIPSTVGGAIYINLHYFQFLISQFVDCATVYDLENNKIIKVDSEWFDFKYDHSKLFERKHILLSAQFKLKQCSQIEAAYSRGRSHEIIRHRKQRYPYSGTCGSFFRNFLPEEVTIESNGKKMIYAAYYLDKVGVKGSLKIGGAAVSYQHANMIVNVGNAKSADIIAVAREMQMRVYHQFGIVLKPECELLGFKDYPLMQ
jgi:UDP-N-acetylmuramate dehydrogenase